MILNKILNVLGSADNKLGTPFHKYNGTIDRFIIKIMRTYVQNSYVSTTSGHVPRCSRCEAVLRKEEVEYKHDRKTGKRVKVVKVVKFRNAHEAMALGKHSHNCGFACAVAVLMNWEGSV